MVVPRPSVNGSWLSQAVSVVGGPVTLLLGLVLALGEMALLPIAVAVVVTAELILGGRTGDDNAGTVC